MKIAIIGCGWVGSRLGKYLVGKNHHVIATTTTPEKVELLKESATEVYLLDFNTTKDFDFLKNIDYAIFSMPISRDSWLEGFQKLQIHFPKTMLFSSTGIYPQENKTFTEKDRDNLRSDILNAENLVREKYPQTNILRFGGLMGDERGLKNMFKNRTPENPSKLTNYIHYDDILKIVELFLNSPTQGETYNIVAPEHPTIAEVLGVEISSEPAENQPKFERLISSEKLIQDYHYTFIHPNPKYF
ncbi:NAD(P)-binding domain-containing protein [Chryseobacterium sp. MP_3.2]|uniref:NAD(P)-binding domain-containing protein n=1 Tax=Chryseobacterium sp. MP_3.2 TaxID=3071712 RepID=UPI002E02BFFC|nr:nucleoside-diphosphate-sugar epimerase [Chryseobacterium sp. MP_3.2]